MEPDNSANVQAQTYWGYLHRRTMEQVREHFAWVYAVLSGIVAFALQWAFLGWDKAVEDATATLISFAAAIVVGMGTYVVTFAKTASRVYAEQLGAVETVEKNLKNTEGELEAFRHRKYWREWLRWGIAEQMRRAVRLEERIMSSELFDDPASTLDGDVEDWRRETVKRLTDLEPSFRTRFEHPSIHDHPLPVSMQKVMTIRHGPGWKTALAEVYAQRKTLEGFLTELPLLEGALTQDTVRQSSSGHSK